MREPARAARRIVVAAAGCLSATALLGILGLLTPVPVWSLWPTATATVALAAAACLLAAATTSGPGRAFWRRFALAAGLLDVALAGQSADTLRHPEQAIAMSPPTGALYLVAVVVGLVALVRLPGPRRHWRVAAGLALDVAVVVVAAGLVLAQLLVILPPPLSDHTSAIALQLIDLAAGSAAVVAVIKVGMSGTGPVAARAMWMLGPVGLLGPASVLAAPVLQPWPHLNAAVFAIPIFGLCLAAAAQAQTRANLTAAAPGPQRAPRRRRGISKVPYVAVAVTAVMLLLVTVSRGSLPAGLAGGAVVLILLVVVRQHAALTDNNVLLDRLVDQARHDELTALPNRRGFTDTLNEHPGPATVAVCDLDGFAALNDRLGDDTGDAILREAAHRVRLTTGGTATVARLVGDEFGVLVGGDGTPLAEALLDAFHTPLSVDGHDLLITVTVGLAAGDGAEVPDLLRRAELALQAAKRVGGNRHQRHTSALDATADHAAHLAAALRHGLDLGEFRVFYQPIVELPCGTPRAVEALVRWFPGGGTPVSPAEFIPVAEQTGLIIDLGAWILDTACADAAGWQRRHGTAAPRVSVNVSARQLLDPDLPSLVAGALRRHGLAPRSLTLEITETAVFAGGPALATVHALRELGVGIALDDFGTGHSSLTLLRTCPVTTLKVDKSFIDDLNGSPQQEAIAVSLHGIAATLGLTAVAEGVETEAQADRLHTLGYTYAQGFHFARPAPAAEIDRMLAETALKNG